MNLSKARILVTGAGGMLGSEIVQALPSNNLLLTDYLASSGIELLDIADEKKVNKLVQEFRPDILINCAAYTNVDLAEKEVQKCFLINAIGPQNLANSLRDSQACLVHISTDYVFGANAQNTTIPYTEEDAASPCGVYGMSKYVGDRFVSLIRPDNSLIARTSWLHGRNGKSFVDKIVELGSSKSELTVVDDQYGSPTWAPWLAEVIVKLLESDKRGIYNACSKGGISWFDFAKEIISQAGLSCKVLPQSTRELARPAPRPAYSVLDISKLEKVLGSVVTWQHGISEHFKYSKK